MSERKVTYLRDYKAPSHLIPHLHLTFELDPTATIVTNEMHLAPNPKASPTTELVLNGERQELLKVELDGFELSAADYELSDSRLKLKSVPTKPFVLKIKSKINPQANSALEGLYISGGKFCTQNEPEGFRRTTYFIDRPDVMSRYKTTIIADKKDYPVLLSNGNPIERRDLENGRHLVTWHDPFPKPCYLFALVGGNLSKVEDQFVTRSGRKVALQIFVEPGKENLCEFAMGALKRSMKWDEDRFGLEYDLDIFMIVAVDDFNFGAMENKGLNIFNSRGVLADKRTASDERMESVEGLIAHEYFHNWTGDRVTCRDWFQLTLKEGLTVLRDEEFTADMTDAAVKRIKDVKDLRERQFPEDSGPMSHPIQPKSYLEINNFYTATVYDKGAAVIRMLLTFLGRQGFRRGIDKYFELFDGQAVTTEDFIHAMETANGFDLKQFRNWYHQNGTPVLNVRDEFDEKNKTYTLNVEQSSPHHKSDENLPWQPYHLPLAIGLLDKSGKDMKLEVDGHTPREDVDTAHTLVLHLREKQQSFVFRKVAQKPVLSILRDFSAPVKLEYNRQREELAFLMSHDSDPFNRWEAGDRLAFEVIREQIANQRAGRPVAASKLFVNAFSDLLESHLNPAFKALAITLPPESSFTDEQNPTDFESTHLARNAVIKELARANAGALWEIYDSLHGASFTEPKLEIGSRRLKNRALSYLMQLDDPDIHSLCLRQLKEATNMTDEQAALMLLADADVPQREEALKIFHDRWKDDTIVSGAWLMAQASSRLPDTLLRVQQLRSHPVFNVTNPNKVRFLWGVFAHNNLHFNAKSGSGYNFIAKCIIEVDPINPSVASGLANAFSDVQRLPVELKAFAKSALQEIISVKDLSPNTFEIVDRCLKTVS